MDRKEGEGSGEYALRIRDETARYVRDLVEDNARLRARVAALETDLGRHHGERVGLEQRLGILEAESRRQLAQFVDLEMQMANVASLYVATFRLFGTLERDDVLAAIREIVINLIGSEELGVFELDETKQRLVLAHSFGLAEGAWESVPVGHGIIGATAASGELFVAADAAGAAGARFPEEEHLSVCVPLLLDGRVLGVVAVFRMLTHKRGLEDVDRELFGLLARQAACALYCATLKARGA